MWPLKNNKTKRMKKITFLLVFFCSIFSCNTEKTNFGLKDNKEFHIGTAIKIGLLTKDSKLQRLQKENFNSIT